MPNRGEHLGETPRVVSVQVGRIAPLGPDSVPSAFVKAPVTGAIAVATLGLAGDEQADLRVHGGADKAVYGYSFANYDIWRRQFPEHDGILEPGAFGENLTIAGLVETEVCIGDIVRVGSVALQVSQPRQPCFKFALRFKDPRMPRAMTANGCCGWYYSVVEEGRLSTGDTLTLERRLNSAWTVDRVSRLMLEKDPDPAELREVADIPGLAKDWRTAVLEKLA